MITASSNYYYRFPQQIEQRLDENYNNPKYDEILHQLENASYPIVQLGEPSYLKNIISGKTPKGIEYVEEGIPFLGASNIPFGKVDVENAPKIPEEIHESVLASSQIKKNNVLITMAGTIGRCAVYTSNQECNANQAVAILEINTEKILPEFLVRYLNSHLGQLFFSKFQHISSQPNINTEEIKQIKVILPEDVTEQKAILEQLKPIETQASEFEQKSKEKKQEAKEVFEQLIYRSRSFNAH